MSNTRTITIYNTRGGKPKKIETDVATWGELRPLIKNEGFEIDKQYATESVRKTDLNNEAAVLPAENFIVFLRAKKTKSGVALGYKDAKTLIKKIIGEDGAYAKAHFCGVKNYTHMSTVDLNAALNSYVTPVAVAKQDNVDDVVEDVTTHEAHSCDDELFELSPSEKLDNAKDLIYSVCATINTDDVDDRVESICEDIDALKEDIAELSEEEIAANAEDERIAEASDSLGLFHD